MKNFFILLIAGTFLSCDNSQTEEEQDFYYGTGIELSVFNSQNDDLLNPENSNHLDGSKIKLFYVIDGAVKEYYEEGADLPRNFLIFKHEKEYRLRLFLNHIDQSEKTITYIQWDEADRDTIEATFERSKNSILKKKIWLNGDLVWEAKGLEDSPCFVLKK